MTSVSPIIPAPTSSPRRRRGFALPLVVLLSLVAALMATVMLDRLSTQNLTVYRELEDYRTTHMGRGLREVVDLWMRSVASRRVADHLAEDGKALDMQLTDGSTVSLYVSDGQGAMLADFSALRDEDKNLGAQMLSQLRSASFPVPDTERTYGPLAISAATATPEVLQAASIVLAGPDAGPVFAEAVLKARAQKRLASTDIAEAASKAQLEGEPRGKVLRLITAEPTLWRVRADVLGPRSERVVARAEMEALSPGNRSRDRSGALQRTATMNFRWVPLDEVTPP